jgi:predicted methyltransferase
MLRHAFILGAALSATFALSHAATAATPAYITAAVTDSARPDADKQRDANRKPAETLTFAGVKPGTKVVELVPGGGYFTRMFSKVVGPKGKVFAWVPPRPADAPADAPDRAAAVRALAADAGYSNITVVQGLPEAGFAAEPVDLVFTAQNYHDVHNAKAFDTAAFNKKVFEALKPGGVFVVLDHSAEKGSGTRDTNTLHRIDEETVKSEVQAAGFKFEGASKVLANPDDPRTAKVFDPAIRGKTDQFILKFVKPKK